eukprot:7349663-Prymnesium_polylepis.2
MLGSCGVCEARHTAGGCTAAHVRCAGAGCPGCSNDVRMMRPRCTCDAVAFAVVRNLTDSLTSTLTGAAPRGSHTHGRAYRALSGRLWRRILLLLHLPTSGGDTWSPELTHTARA